MGTRAAQVVDELSARIAAGDLAPGDRVPSTREIVRHWGVAMATATKVLTELRHAGLVRAVPGVGTVVVGTRERPARPAADGAVRMPWIVSAAVRVADAEGLAAVSMRRVANETGVAAMSLYRHVTDKQDLIARMQDAVFTELRLPASGEGHAGGWRVRLELAAQELWSTFRRHPWLAPALSLTRPQPLANALPFTEWVLAALDDAGFDVQTAFTAYLTLYNYVRGTAVDLEREAEAAALTGMDPDQWVDTQRASFTALAGAEHPRFERLMATEYPFDLDALFDFGLQRLLDGLVDLSDAAGSSRGPRHRHH